MRVLLADPPFTDPDVERDVAGSDLDILVWRIAERGPIPDQVFRSTDAVVNYRANTRITADEAALLDRCRIVCQGGVGFNHIDIEALGARGIPVCNCPDYGTMEVADHAIGLMLALTRGIVAYDRKLRDRRIAWTARGQTNVRRIHGRTFAVLGLGRIGLAAALRARAFGMEVVFFDPYVAPGIERALGFGRAASVAELVARADVVSVHTPLTAETEGLIDGGALGHARPELILVNTARGPVVDLDALETALREGRIAGAALDVLPVEPMTYDHPLVRAWAADADWLDGRLVITPHAAYYSADGVADMRRLTMTTVVDYLRHGTLRSCVNAAALRPARA